MPIVTITWWQGRTKEQKAKLAKKITEAMTEVVGAPPEVVHVVFEDVSKENWAIGGKLSSEPPSP